MIITHKIQCFPNKTQKYIINQTLGACRWIHNQYLAYNIENHKEGIPFTTARSFSELLTQLKKNDVDYIWLKGISQKAVRGSVIDCENSFRKFFDKTGGFPKFKSKHRDPVMSYYLYPVTGKHKHNKIKLPLLGWMRIRENSYVIHSHIINARMIKTKQDKYFIHLSTEIPSCEREILSPGIGIDVGIKKYLSIANEDNNLYQIEPFIRDDYIKRKESKIIKLQQIISNKVEINYNRLLNKYYDKYKETPNEITKNKMRGESYNSNCIYKLRKKIVSLNKKISDYKKNKINKIVYALVKAKPEYIAIEDLSIHNMISKTNENHSKTLSKYITDSNFYYFKTRLIHKCQYFGIPIHLANKYFASSKKCCVCGYKNKELKLNDRVYICPECGNSIDRDLNAAINLVHMKKKDYKIKQSL